MHDGRSGRLKSASRAELMKSNCHGLALLALASLGITMVAPKSLTCLQKARGSVLFPCPHGIRLLFQLAAGQAEGLRCLLLSRKRERVDVTHRSVTIAAIPFLSSSFGSGYSVGPQGGCCGASWSSAGRFFFKSEQRLKAGLDLLQATDGQWGLLESLAMSEPLRLSVLRALLKEVGCISAKPPGAWRRKGPEPRACAGGKRAAEPGIPGRARERARGMGGGRKKSIFNH